MNTVQLISKHYPEHLYVSITVWGVTLMEREHIPALQPNRKVSYRQNSQSRSDCGSVGTRRKWVEGD